MFETNTPITLELGIPENESVTQPAFPAPAGVEAAYLEEIALPNRRRKAAFWASSRRPAIRSPG